MNELVHKWKKTRLLHGTPKKYRESLAACLESQRLFNEADDSISPRSKRISIPLVLRLFNKVENLHNSRFIYGLNDFVYTHTFNYRYNPPEPTPYYTLDADAEATALLAEGLANELYEVFLQDQLINFVAISIGNDYEVKLHYNFQED